LAGQKAASPLAGTNTTIGVVATNASLNKAQVKRLAMSAHDGFARSIRPAHTSLDGDTLFAMATCAEEGPPDMVLLTVMAAEATAQAIVNAILFANGVHTLRGYLPSAMELNP
jgi:L-aminopeptidase/D-esterase-like protein